MWRREGGHFSYFFSSVGHFFLLFCCKELKSGNMLIIKCFLLERENLYVKNSYIEILYSSQIIFENCTPIFFSEQGYYNLHAQEKNDTCKNKINISPRGHTIFTREDTGFYLFNSVLALFLCNYKYFLFPTPVHCNGQQSTYFHGLEK